MKLPHGCRKSALNHGAATAASISERGEVSGYITVSDAKPMFDVKANRAWSRYCIDDRRSRIFEILRRHGSARAIQPTRNSENGTNPVAARIRRGNGGCVVS